jgi:hypothetical protein
VISEEEQTQLIRGNRNVGKERKERSLGRCKDQMTKTFRIYRGSKVNTIRKIQMNEGKLEGGLSLYDDRSI